MDEYLEGLVKKGTVKEEKESDPVVESKQGESGGANLSDVLDAELAAELNASIEEENDTEVISTDDSQLAEVKTLTENSSRGDVNLAAKDKLETQVETGNLESNSVLKYTKGQLIPVNGIRVFNTPDETGTFKLVSGNIVFDQLVDRFAIIQYMKSGFGLVKGYTTDLK